MNKRHFPASYSLEPGEYDWLEKAGLENLKGRVATADVLAKEAVTTLTVLLAGAGGAFAYAVKLFDEAAKPSTFASAVAVVWLICLAMWLVMRCLMIGELQAIYNQPGELARRGECQQTFPDWRFAELKNIEERIALAVARNDKTALHLNRIRVCATITPLISAGAALLFSRYWF